MNHNGKWVVLLTVIVIHLTLLFIVLPHKPLKEKPVTPESVRIKLTSSVQKEVPVPDIFKPEVLPEIQKPIEPEQTRTDLSEPVIESPVSQEEPVVLPIETGEQSPKEPKLEPVKEIAPVLSKEERSSIRAKWLSGIRSIVEKKKRYPKQAMLAEIEGVVRVQLTILLCGTVQSVSIPSQKLSILERATLESLHDLKQVPPIPSELHESILTVEIPLVYELK